MIQLISFLSLLLPSIHTFLFLWCPVLIQDSYQPLFILSKLKLPTLILSIAPLILRIYLKISSVQIHFHLALNLSLKLALLSVFFSCCWLSILNGNENSG